MSGAKVGATIGALTGGLACIVAYFVKSSVLAILGLFTMPLFPGFLLASYLGQRTPGTNDGLVFGVLANMAIYALAGLVIGHVIFPHSRYPPGHCQRCGYNLKANVSGVCPECGTRVLAEGG